MAVATGLALSVGSAAYAANQQKKGAQGAANTVADASNASIAEQRMAREQSRQDQMPWMQAGQSALGQLQALNSGDFSSFKESPDYQFTFDQGLQGLDRSAAARGSLNSGGADADRIAYGQGMASQQYGNYYNRIASLAGAGQQAASGLGALGANAANQIGNSMQNAGAARASSYLQRGDANSQLASGLGGLANYGLQQWQASRPQGGMVGPVTRQPTSIPTPAVTVPNVRPTW